MDEEIKTGEMTGEIDESITVEEDFTLLEGKAVSITDDSDNKTSEDEAYEEALDIKESLDDIRQQIKDKLLDILEKGKITDADGCEIELLNDQYNEKYNELKDLANTVIPGGKGASIENASTTDNSTTEIVKINIDYDEILKTINEKADWLYIDEDGQVMLNGEVVPKLKVVELEAEKIKADVGEFKDLTTENFTATNAEIENLKANKADIEYLTANYATIQNLNATNAEITNLKSDYGEFKNLTAENFTAVNADIDNLTANKADVDYLTSNYATINMLNTNVADINTALIDKANVADLNATNALVEDLRASKADIADLTAVNAKITNLEAGKADIAVLEANYATIKQLDATNANVTSLQTETANINKALIDKANVVDLNATNAKVTDLQATKADISDLNAAKANISTLTSDLADITTLVNGNLTSDNIQSMVITGDKFTVADGFIKNAMIDSVNANKINAGIINTNNVSIQSNDGSMVLQGNLQQFKDKNGKVRIQIGKDATGNFTFVLYDENGTGQLINQNGIQSSNAIADGLIVDSKVADNANIAGSKLDIDSVVTEVNNGSTSIKGTKIYLDDQKQSLNVAFNNMTNTVKGNTSTLNSHTTSINTMNGKVTQLISDTTITKENGTTVSLKDAYNTTVDTVNSHSTKIGSLETNLSTANNNISSVSSKQAALEQNLNGFKQTVSDTYTTKADFNGLKIGGTNLIANSAPKSTSGWQQYAGSSGAWTLSLVDCSSSTYGKAIRATSNNAAGGGMHKQPIDYTKLVKNEYYTLSAWIRASKNCTANFKNEYMSKDNYINITTEWKYYSYTDKLTGSGNHSDVIYLSSGIQNGMWIEVHSLKLEKGTKPSSWSPAPQDVDDSITVVDSKFANYSTTSQMNSAITQKANEITSSVSETYATKASLTTVDNKFANYSTTSAMNSAINQKSDAILSTVSKTYATQTSLADVSNNLKNNYSTTSAMNSAINQKANEITSSVSETYATKKSVSDVSNNLKNNYSTTSAMNSAINQKANEITSSVSQTYATKASVTDVSNNLKNNYSTTSAMNSAINQKGDSILSTVSNTYTTKADFNSLDIGGNNILPFSSIHNYELTSFSTDKQNFTVTGTHDTKFDGVSINPVPYMTAGQKGILQFKLKKNSGTLTNIGCHVDNVISITKALVDGVSRNLQSPGSDSWGIDNTNWHHVIIYFTYKGGTPANPAMCAQPNRILDTTVNVTYKEIKVEIGNKPSAWSPCIKDIQGDIATVDGKFANYSTTTQMNSAINQKANEITSSVSNTYATKAALNTVDGKFANYSTTTAMNTAINQKADSITQSVSNTYATKTSLNTANNNITSLTNRMSSAESKLTKNSLTTTIGNYYTTSSDVNGLITAKGYATTSQVSQTATDLTAKFSSSGGYNLLRNSVFTRSGDFWDLRGSTIDTSRTLNGHNSIKITSSGATSNVWKGFIQRFADNIPSGKTYTASLWYYIANKSTFDSNFVLELKGKKTGATSETAIAAATVGTSNLVQGAWTKLTVTATTNEAWQYLYIYPWVQKNGTIWVTELQVEEGSLATLWTPHPYETYDGITQINKDGIKVYHNSIDSNSYTHMSPNGFYIKNKGTDIFKVDTNGLYFKGKAEITSGSMPSSLLTGTIDNARLNSTIVNGANNGTSAKSTLDSKASGWDSTKSTVDGKAGGWDSTKSTVDSNKTNWSNAYNRVAQWAYGAVTGNTTINGGLIQTGTITAKNIYLGDLTNYCNLIDQTASLYGFTTEADNGGTWFKLNNNIRDTSISGNGIDGYKVYKCNGGESFRIKYQIKSNVKGSSTNGGTDSVYCKVNVGCYGYSSDGNKFYSLCNGGTSDANSTVQNINATIKIPDNARTFGVFLQLDKWNNWSGTCRIRNVQVIKMSSAELIVDGSITAGKIAANAIVADKIAAGAVTADKLSANSVTADKIAAGAITANKLSADAITGKTIIGGTISGTEVTGGSFNVEGQLTANRIVCQDIDNARYPATLDGNLELYVNSSTGNDDNEPDDGVRYKTLQGAIDAIPKFLNNKTVYITMETDSTEDVFIRGVVGGAIRIYMNGKTLYGTLRSYVCAASINVYGGTKSNTEGATGTIHPNVGLSFGTRAVSVGFEASQYAALYKIKVYAPDNLPSDVSNTDKVCIASQSGTGSVYCKNIQIVNAVIGFRTNNHGSMHVNSSSGVASKYGFQSVTGGIISLANNKQAGGKTANTNKNSGGQVWYDTDGPTFDTGNQTTDGGSAPVVSTTKTLTVKSSYGDTYRSSVYNNWKKDGTCRQGDYGYGDCNGCWFFGSAFSEVKGKTISKVTISITRNDGGSSSAVGLVVKSHGYSGRPSGAPTFRTTAGTLSLATGATDTLTITNSTILNEISSGTVKGFGIQATYDSSHYAVCSGSCTVKITYTE